MAWTAERGAVEPNDLHHYGQPPISTELRVQQGANLKRSELSGLMHLSAKLLLGPLRSAPGVPVGGQELVGAFLVEREPANDPLRREERYGVPTHAAF